jgi:exosome complex component RRP43
MTITTTFPAPVFAALTPAPYLHAHLSQSPATRPSNRSPSTARKPVLNVSSLTHAAGSAVVRVGDTAVVAGVRAEILAVKDATSSGSGGAQRAAEMMDVLVVPNVEFATGCSGDQVPGSAPSGLAQATAWRVKDVLVASGFISPLQLEIRGRKHGSSSSSLSSSGEEEESDEDDDDDMAVDGQEDKEEQEIVGYFVLYIDLVIISLAGSPFPPLWAACLAALRSTRLPHATYSQQLETIVCSPLLSQSSQLHTNGLPFACTYRVFEPQLEKGLRDKKDTWVLADPDAFEESVCREEITVVLDCSESIRILRLQKRGGFVVDEVLMKDIISLSTKRWTEWHTLMNNLP